LAKVAEAAASRGSLVVISNVNCREIKELYQDEVIFQVSRNTGFGRANGGPSTAKELLIVFDQKKHLSNWKTVLRSLGA
jgi:site-specific DNA-adenine methylase